MLTAEQAEEALKKFEIPDWEERRKRELGGLGARYAGIGRGMLGLRAWGRAADKDPAVDMDALKPNERTAIFDVIFPGLGASLEAMWTAGQRMPYQWGYTRRGFRAPNDAELTRDARSRRFAEVLDSLRGYAPDETWIARWAPFLDYARGLGVLLATIIDRGDKSAGKIFDLLVASARGEDEIGGMGRHVTTALLTASRPDGWTFVEGLLLAAQREEGLRQAVFEAVDEAHPDAFRRMLDLIVARDLVRFSSTVRALDVWLGYLLGGGSVAATKAAISTVSSFLKDDRARDEALRGDKPEQIYLALWCVAFVDAPEAVRLARGLLGHKDAEVRFATAHLLRQVALSTGRTLLAPLLDDPDLRVASLVLGQYQRGNGWDLSKDPDEAFERLGRLFKRVPEEGAVLPAAVWPWTAGKLERSHVASAIVNVGSDRPVTDFVPFLDGMEPTERAYVARRLSEVKRPDRQTRDLLLRFLADLSHEVRTPALSAIANARITEADVPDLERLLSRKAGDLRRGVVGLLLGLDDRQALASADRLLADDTEERRLAGLELLRQLKEGSRVRDGVRERAVRYAAAHATPTEAEQVQLRALTDAAPVTLATLEDALGLVTPGSRTAVRDPQRHKVRRTSEAAAKCLLELDELVHANRDVTVTFSTGFGLPRQELLGNMTHEFPVPMALRGWRGQLDLPPEEPVPLHDEWMRWARDRGPATRDGDGLELMRALVLSERTDTYGREPFRGKVDGVEFPTLRYPMIVRRLVLWLAKGAAASGSASFVLDVAENALAGVSRGEIQRARERKPTEKARDYLEDLERARLHRRLAPDQWTRDDLARLWDLLCWLDTTDLHIATEAGIAGAFIIRSGPLRSPAQALDEVVASFSAGVATEGDVLAFALNAGSVSDLLGGRWSFRDFGELSRRRPRHKVAQESRLAGLIARARERVIAIELGRGEAPTAASAPALALRHSGGLDVLMPVLRALGKEPFVRGWQYDGLSRSVVLSHLIRVAFPTADDTPTEFARAAAEAKVPAKRLVELAVFAPHWASHVETAVGWAGLESAVWWLHAHTKDRGWSVDADILEVWKAEVAERTPLASDDLLDGAVDTQWFLSVHGALGDKNWDVLDGAAKYTSSSGGHVRARLFADALRGATGDKELRARIREKRHQDSARALGLLPIPDAGREETILARYREIQEYRRGARQFGSARQASEKRAADIALENLARTAGYADPIRLGWAMEARGAADIASGGLVAQVDDLKITLTLDDLGAPDLAITRGGKSLKSIPAALKKNVEVTALRERQVQLRRDLSRARESLEAAMVRGDTFTGAEVVELSRHPLLSSMFRRLVLVGESFAGYAIEGGKVLEDQRGHREAIAPDEQFRIAHPVDLLATKDWSAWQRDCFARERVQPFKQVFRELYPITRDELASKESSRRYAGHQVQPRHALALLGSRGWVSLPEEGVRRTFHHARVTAWLTFTEGFTSPAEIDGLTIEEVRFSPPGTFDSIPIADVPPRIFSEVMRDLDLAVSVAHLGGVDPEASASSMEMRAVLVQETARLLGLDNVRTDGPRAFIEGTLGSYNVHLGSAIIHRQPGGALFVVPVHSQYRGRLFLPFADDDPKSAEVLSKVLLLARDSAIKDPSILEQIRRR
jgi:HEAT repeat protein